MTIKEQAHKIIDSLSEKASLNDMAYTLYVISKIQQGEKEKTLHNEQDAVIDAPQNKGPGRAVPQAAEQHGDKQVHVCTVGALA